METTLKIEINEQQKAVTGTVELTVTGTAINNDEILAETKRLFLQLRSFTNDQTSKKLGLKDPY